ncbi:MAG: HEAT repeat domain-containing protein [Planctomycetota bacterium]|nr:HEAT repeat domain-containing protein [Planctomycetota bacterium]
MKPFSLLATAFLFAILIAPGSAAPANSPASVAAKRKHLATVIEELSQRDVLQLSPEQRERRATALEHLRAYAARGVFPHNTKLPQYALPYLIDRYGTRCALAYVIDRSGHGPLIERLARTDNHAWVAQLTGKTELDDWMRSNGLTVAEAAFIQAPSIVEDPADLPEPPPDSIPKAPRAPETAPPDSTPPPAPPAETPSTGRTTRTRSPATLEKGSWVRWWRYNRDAFVNLRQRYHAAATTTNNNGDAGGRARRPDDAMRRKVMIPALATLSTANDEVRASALMAWVMAAEKGARAPAVAGTLDYLRKPESRYRDLMLFALGLAQDASATQTLRDILNDTKAGRRALVRKGKVPAMTRAYAAIALGATEDPSAIADLMRVARNEKNRNDLRASALVATGQLLPLATPDVAKDVAALLAIELKRARWERPVLTAIPMTLIRSGDAVGRTAVLRAVARFRGKADVRASCALALGMASDALDAEIVDALLAASRRDPDVQARRFATIALGELCARDASDAADEKVVRKLKRHFLGTIDGHFKAPRVMEWHLLGAGLFARRFPTEGEILVKRLVRVATTGGSRDERAAASIALGLSGHMRGKDALLKLLAKAKDVTLRGAVAESLGLAGVREARPQLRKLALEDKADAVRYQAALGLGYLADGTMIEPLVTELGRTGSGPARAALTRVLGQLGDRRAIPGLIELAQDERQIRSVRERALGALGLIGRESDDSWTLPYRRGCNFAAATPTVRMVLGIF